ncbi:MAG: sulfite exporter TauE/SafE family protein [Clostridia bacterium]|nr:sulfite exporter TauE/SafE family protein [Clostridia bacterium]
MVQIILGTLFVFAVMFIFIFVKDYLAVKKEGKLENINFFTAGAIGAVVNFFDTLGVGSFAPSAAIFKFTKMVDDKQIPGTLNVANCLPVIAEAFIFITVVKVDTTTLVAILVSCSLGAYIGAGLVSKLPKVKVQLSMAVALLLVATIMICKMTGLMPPGGDAVGLTGIKLVIGCIGAFIAGITQCFGVGCFAPIMALVFTLGMSPLVAFPIMMGSAAFLQPVASIKFVKEGAFNRHLSMAFNIFGVVGVLLAAFLVKSMSVDTLNKLVVAVVFITSVSMLRSAVGKNESKSEPVMASN